MSKPSQIIQTYFRNEGEKEEIVKLADSFGLSPSSFLRTLALHKLKQEKINNNSIASNGNEKSL